MTSVQISPRSAGRQLHRDARAEARSREIEEISDHVVHAARAAEDQLGDARNLLGIAVAGHREQCGTGSDRAHGRAQVVAEHPDEMIAVGTETLRDAND